MNRRFDDRFIDKDFADSNVDEFPATDKMPLVKELKDFADTDFADSVIAEEMDQETMSAALYAEFETSRINTDYAAMRKDKSKEVEIDPRVWKFDFTDSAQDIKDGTTVREINSSEDLFNKYFKS
jgi:hypothetical protein